MIFLESTKKEENVERQLDHLEKFTRVKTYHEFDDEIPYLEGGIPILGQSMEYPLFFEAPYSPHEEVPTTLSKLEVHLDDVIERIEKLSLDENLTPSKLAKPPGPSKKVPPKWLIKHLKVFISMRVER